MGERRGVYGVLVGKPEGKSHLEDPGLDGKLILKCTFRKYDGGMDCNDLAQKRDRWRDLVNAVMIVLVP